MGVLSGFRAGSYTAVAADASAGTVDIELPVVPQQLFVSIFRSGSEILSDQAISISGSTLTVADGSATYALTAGDVIHWLATE